MEIRSLLVPFVENAESERSLDVACKLASDRGATIAIVHVVEVPTLLPIEAHMTAEERAAHLLLERAAAIAGTYGINVVTRILHGRDAGEAIVAEAAARRVDLIVLGAPRKRRRPFGSTVEHVLRKADSRVMMIGAAPEPASLRETAAA